MKFLRYALTALMFVLLAAHVAQGADERVYVPLEGSPSVGPSDAPLTIVEFLDYQ